MANARALTFGARRSEVPLAGCALACSRADEEVDELRIRVAEVVGDAESGGSTKLTQSGERLVQRPVIRSGLS